MRPVMTTAVVAILLTGCAGTPAALKPQAAATAGHEQGYLSAGLIEALAEATPPPPLAESATAVADRAHSERFRTLEDSDRWLMAAAHAELRPPLALQHFDCALGVRLGAAETPHLNRLMQRLFEDANATAERVKTHAFRARPVGDDPDRRACQRLSAAGRNSASYPSGSAAVAAVYGEAFAALAPDRAEEARATARQIALSRLVCAMHYPSDVETGEGIGRAVFELASQSPEFTADLEASRTELAAIRAAGLSSPGCAAERAAFATPLP